MCGRPMSPWAIPVWVLDLDEKRVLGLAHSTCAKKLPPGSTILYKPDEPPPDEAEIEFRRKIRDALESPLLTQRIKTDVVLCARAILVRALEARIKDEATFWRLAKELLARHPAEKAGKVEQLLREVMTHE